MFPLTHRPRRLRLMVLLAAGLALASFLKAAANQPDDSDAELVRLLAAGKQEAAESQVAEALRRDPQNARNVFWSAVLSRSRFNVREAAPAFLRVLQERPGSPEGMLAACVLGIDFSDRQSALCYYNSLLILAAQDPDSIPIHWMAGVMARALTRWNADSDDELHKRLLNCGVSEYEKLLTLLSRVTPGPGPVLLHQAMANLLDDLDGSDLALVHRQIAMRLERTPHTLQGAAETLRELGRAPESVPLALEALSIDPNDEKAYRTLGKAYRQLGMLPEAITAWDHAMQVGSPNTDYLTRVCMMESRNLGDIAAAHAYAEKGIASDPTDRFYQVWEARLAVMLGRPGAGERLMKAGTLDFSEKPIPFENLSTDPWFVASNFGDLAKVRQLIPTNDINKTTPPYKQTALMNAARDGWETIVAELIKAHVKLDEVDVNGDTALNYSADFGNPRITKLLLDAGANPNILDKWVQTPLFKCCGKHNWEGFLFLLEKNPDVNLGAGKSAGAALHYACGHGDVPMIDLLIKHGADVNLKNRVGKTPLMSASAEFPHPYVINPLLRAGADINAKDTEGRTALHHAMNPLLNIPLVEMLMEKGANPTVTDKHGTTPITQARLLGFEEIARAMEKKTGKPEPLQFPEFTPPGDFSREEQNAVYYNIPILLGQGNPLGLLSSVAPNSQTAKKEARKELSYMFGIHTDADLRAELDALVKFEPRFRDDAEGFASSIDKDELKQALLTVVKKTHASCIGTDAIDETAWTQSHIIYLADLGVVAGFLTQAEATALIASASAKISASFHSWPEFAKSFVLGARFYAGWQADRYQHICDRIIESGLRWP